MNIRYVAGADAVEGSAFGAKVMLTNGRGAYALLKDVPDSRYDGVFFFASGRMYRSIEAIEGLPQMEQVTHSLGQVEWSDSSADVKVFMPKECDALVVDQESERTLRIILDCKESYDNREFGRHYEILEHEGVLVVHYRKRDDARDNNTTGAEYDVFVAVYAPGLKYRALKEWYERDYYSDADRASPPAKRFVFAACEVSVKRFACASALDKKSAVDAARLAFEAKAQPVNVPVRINATDARVRIAYQAAALQLQGLSVSPWLFAGLPWFFQFWARDTLISARALMLLGDFERVRTLLLSLVQELPRSHSCRGQLPTFPGASLCSADGAGWLFARIRDFSQLAKVSMYAWSPSDQSALLQDLNAYLHDVSKYRMKDGLVENGHHETWMDTSYATDDRTGARVEIQALALSSYRTRTLLGASASEEEVRLRARAREFFDGDVLADGSSDKTVRPNVFIAAYVYPQLLSPEEWERVFDTALERLWLEWGGLSSIDRQSALFTDTYTGETLQSYHRGDSWFWLNNLAAIAMHRVNKIKYHERIEKILNASIEEQLFSGALAHCAEVSSARERSSKGCLSQAWSAALLIELLHELHA